MGDFSDIARLIGARRPWLAQFGAVSDVIRNAARIPPDRTIAPEQMQAACAYGLDEIFGTG